MNKRVEICGIDTSSLPKLSHAEGMELLKRAHNGDELAREEFLMANMRLVLSVVKRFSGKKENPDDIFQVGCVGLIKAAENFDVSLNLRFSTYAVPMIIGEIRRYLRDCSPVRISRSIRDTAYKALSMRSRLEAASGAEASMEDIAAALNLPVREVMYALDAISDTVSLFDPVYHDSDETVMIMDQIADEQNSDEKWVTGVSVSQALAALGEREQNIVRLRFYEGKTQIEVSQEIGISQAQVSRLEKNALKEIGKSLE